MGLLGGRANARVWESGEGGGPCEELECPDLFRRGRHAALPAPPGSAARWPDFPFFFFPKRSRKSGLFHKISPFLNAARMYKARCGPTKICLRVTIRLLPPLASCLLGSGSARPFHASLPAQLSLLETPVFCCSVRAHFCSFWNRRLTPHFLSEACPEPPYRGLTVYALLLHSPLPPRLVTSPPQVVLCPRS